MNFAYTDFEDYFASIFGQPTAATALKTIDQATFEKLKEDAR